MCDSNTYTCRCTSLFTSQLRLRTQAWRTTLKSWGCLGCWWLRKRMPVSSSMLTKPGWDAGRDRHPYEVTSREKCGSGQIEASNELMIKLWFLSISLRSPHTFLLFVWQNCWLSLSVLHLHDHHLGPCLQVLGYLPHMKGRGMEGAVPRCRTASEGHGAHRSDRERPKHSSAKELTSSLYSMFDVMNMLECDVRIKQQFLAFFSFKSLTIRRYKWVRTWPLHLIY